MKRGIYILFFSLVAMVLGSCVHKELCKDHNHNSNIVLKVNWHLEWNIKYIIDWDVEWNPEWEIDWSKVIPTNPEGVRLIAESHEDNSRQTFNLPSDGGIVKLQPGIYTALLHNNDTEYIVYEESDHVASVTATTRSRSRSPYSENNPTEKTVNAPDFLFTSFTDRFQIDDFADEAGGEEERVIEMDVPMYPVVFSYIIRFEFNNGKEYINDARGALSGMGGTVNLSNRRTLDDVVTVLYEDAEVSDYGVEAVVSSFDLCNFDPIPTDEYPNGHFYTPDDTGGNESSTRNDSPKSDGNTRNILTLELALKSGNVKTFEIDVTERMREQPRGGVLLIQGLEITPDEGEGSQTGGFEVDVNEWGDSEIVDLPL